MTQEEKADYILELVHVNPFKGELRWKHTRGKTKADSLAGSDSGNGYRHVNFRINGKQKKAFVHRVIFYYYYGFMPEEVDHIDRNRSNNRIDNLRQATRIENSRNMSASRRNKSGCLGVHWSKSNKKWCAQIKIEGKGLHLGAFDDKDEAIKARKAAEQEHFKEFAPV